MRGGPHPPLRGTFPNGGRLLDIASPRQIRIYLTEQIPKKTYYVRIRTYKTVKGRKYYSAWSGAKSATVKE